MSAHRVSRRQAIAPGPFAPPQVGETVESMCDRKKIPYLVYWGHTCKGNFPQVYGWMQWSYEECMDHNRHAGVDPGDGSTKYLMINLQATDIAILDVDAPEMDRVAQDLLRPYGSMALRTTSCSRHLPHYWLHKTSNKNIITSKGIDYIANTLFEEADSSFGLTELNPRGTMPTYPLLRFDARRLVQSVGLRNTRYRYLDTNAGPNQSANFLLIVLLIIICVLAAITGFTVFGRSKTELFWT